MAIGAFALTSGSVAYFHNYEAGSLIAFLGLLMILLTMAV